MRGGCLLAVGARRARGSNKFSSVHSWSSCVVVVCVGVSPGGPRAWSRTVAVTWRARRFTMTTMYPITVLQFHAWFDGPTRCARYGELHCRPQRIYQYFADPTQPVTSSPPLSKTQKHKRYGMASWSMSRYGSYLELEYASTFLTMATAYAHCTRSTSYCRC